MNANKVQAVGGDTVGKRRVPAEPQALEDGVYWFRVWINLRGGGYVDEWKVARVIGGMVQRFGSEAMLDQNCEYLRHSIWVRIEPPPHNDANAVCLLTDVRRRKRGSVLVTQDDNRAASERVRKVAEGIVDAFLAMQDSTAGYYARNPDHREELVAQIARLIASVRG